HPTFGRQQTGQSSTYHWLDPADRSMGTTISSPQESHWWPASPFIAARRSAFLGQSTPPAPPDTVYRSPLSVGCPHPRAGSSTSPLVNAEQGFFRVLRRKGSHGVGPAVFFQFHPALATTDETNVAEVPASVGLHRLDFRGIVGGPPHAASRARI